MRPLVLQLLCLWAWHQTRWPACLRPQGEGEGTNKLSLLRFPFTDPTLVLSMQLPFPLECLIFQSSWPAPHGRSTLPFSLLLLQLLRTQGMLACPQRTHASAPTRL